MIETSSLSASPAGRAFLFALLLAASGGSHAQQAVAVSLDGASEVPPVATSATGRGQIAVQRDRSVSGNVQVSGFAPTVAHIHEAAAGKNGPPVVTLNKTASDSFAVPDGSVLSEAQYASYLAGNLYFNVHSAQHPNGEIRGQIRGRNHSQAPRGEAAGAPMRSGY